MYWLLDYAKQEELRQTIIRLQTELSTHRQRDQSEQQFPFNGRKDRRTASTIIKRLTSEYDTVCDPFSGAGTFGYASLDAERQTLINEWEPYAYRLSTAPFRDLPNADEWNTAYYKFTSDIQPNIFELYKTKCPNCGNEIMFDGLFYDRKPEEYFNPTPHARMGRNGENVIFRGKYKCHCKAKEKRFDDFDYEVKLTVDRMPVDFPQVKLIENSRLNFTHPDFTTYSSLFSHRQQVALIIIFKEIQLLEQPAASFYFDTFLSIIHLGKYVDYHSKSQDNHCPENRIKETNLYHRFLEALESRKAYIQDQHFDNTHISISNEDYRSFMQKINGSEIGLILTDPPYGDSAQYFEHAQRVHPFMGFDLKNDPERLSKEVVISNAPSRTDKHSKEQFLSDIESLFIEGSRVLHAHGFFVMYFRPEQSDWISDLNKLKHFGRKHGLEPLITIPLSNNDPSMRVLASAAWSFSKDICFVFLKLNDCERRWYEVDIDIDELVYLAALAASDNKGLPFLAERFNIELHKKLSKEKLMRLLSAKFQKRIEETLLRYCVKDFAQYKLTGLSPYNYFNREMNAEMRLREFAPIVIEELSADGNGFAFEEYIIHLASFMENGSREIIQKLHTANRLIPELLLVYAEENSEQGKFYAKTPSTRVEDYGKISLYNMDPTTFEHLIAGYFCKRGFVKAEVIGRSCDRGVDILATNAEGELELIQCKRYRKGNNIGSTPIQRVDSYMRSRNAKKAWVVTTSDFTPEGIDEARITGVILINGEDLYKSLELYYPGIYTL